jgi:hypothetical protein
VHSDPCFAIYTVSIWTDPDAARSAVSFDTAEHSAESIARSDAWSTKQRDRLIAAGRHVEAELYRSRIGGRCENPADFAYRDIALIAHTAFPPGWAGATEGRCWKVLGSALLTVQREALREYAALPRHADAVIAVNSAADWYDVPLPFPRTVS